MKNIAIKYNPYKLETEIKIDNKLPKADSNLLKSDIRLQEWIEDLPKILVEECNDLNFDVEFFGTQLDFEDMKEVFESSDLTIRRLNHKPAKETKDKEKLISEVFKEIQEGPFEELKAPALKKAFEQAKNNEFEVDVVATMSAGKSTLINALLQTKLMPSKQEACTAIITRIKDTDSETYQAKVYDDEHELIEELPILSYADMVRLNSDEKVSEITILGDIPFVIAEDAALVIVDTPGPNNSRDPQHKKRQVEMLSESSKALVLYIMTGERGTDDDNLLLRRVSESMKVKGKQSKDRFIFVVNKLDGRTKDDGSLETFLEDTKKYLQNHGIENPNLFPASALTALNIRLLESGEEKDEDVIDETETKVKKLNRNEELYFDQFATLPASIKRKISDNLSSVVQLKESGEKKLNNPKEALIHSGIPSIEAAIQQYVEKYAKTAKIKNIVDTFSHNLEEVEAFENAKKELAAAQEESERISHQIKELQTKISDGNEAKKFIDKVDDQMIKVGRDAEDAVDNVIAKFQRQITKQIDQFRGQEIDIDQAEAEAAKLETFSRNLQPELEVELDKVVINSLRSTSETLLEEYRNKLAAFTEIHVADGIKIEPLKLMEASITDNRVNVEDLIYDTEEEDGQEYVKNNNKAWYKPWTWLQEQGYYKTKYKTVQKISGSEFAQEFLTPVQENLNTNATEATIYAKEQSTKVVADFKKKIKSLDTVLVDKLTKLDDYAKSGNLAKERMKESQKKLAWLEAINQKVESILEI